MNRIEDQSEKKERSKDEHKIDNALSHILASGYVERRRTFWKWSDRRHGVWWDFPGKYFDQSCAALARRKEYGTS